VFRGAETAAALCAVVILFRLARARRRGMALLLLRDGALVAVAMVAVIGVVATLAFDELFLLFHQVFFPRGNFLFDPATSNLLRLYPDWYWQAITGAVTLSFITLSLLVAVAAHLSLRPRAGS
jgi:uncharacterized membrane protein